MAENENGQERSEEATEKRKKESRDKGEIPRSKELTTFLLLVVSGSGLIFMGSDLVAGLMQILRDSLTLDREQIYAVETFPLVFLKMVEAGLTAVFPFFLLLVITAIIAPLAMGGWSFSLKPLGPDIKKMDPIKGLGRVFSAKGLMELAKALAKLVLVGSVGIWILQEKLDDFILLGSQELEVGIAQLGSELVWIFILLSSALLIVALIDAPFQMWDHSRKQKMTRQEIKDEQKETDGNPELKSRIRQTQREISQRRMMQEVPKADVVVTNPTHYAVAIRYDQTAMGAPIIVALGADEMAGHIRRIAEANDVAILSAPPLARALFHNCELNAEIPAGLFLAVAQVLAYVYQLHHYELEGGISPSFNSDVPIPDDLQRDK
ncbi:MAG: flagellar biosynthesis protein FlhB [Ectothiorhodospiraceae bacterium]|nr:flagellar biosynthesis protein FlhB [Ectothiorhodospiraceae bacterium]